MSSTFDIFSIKTVPSDYSWDKGTPNVDYTEFVTELSACVVSSNNEEGVEYVGYAPFAFVCLSSDPGDISRSHLAIKRVANFGDYYNSETNIVTTPTLSNELFCHAYIMPGLYTIEYSRTEYIEVTLKNYPAYGYCLQKYCIDWSWKSTKCTNTTSLSVSWRSATTGGEYQKRWKFEPCEADWAALNGLYIEKLEDSSPLTWQWYNYVSNAPNNRYNTPVPWLSSGFQQPEELTWATASGPCLNLRQIEQTIWRWNNITVTPNQLNKKITWDELKSSGVNYITWNFVRDNCVTSVAPMVSSVTQTITKTAYIKIKEILPTAYIKIQELPDRIFPVEVKLTARDTICGSFPIEKIVWDLGDGSPLLVQRRWSNTLEAPFVFSGAISEDYQDPRNYDVVHTYKNPPESGFSYYPSITAFASSTNSSNCAAAAVGPLKFAATDGSNFKLMQNELTDHGKVLIGQIDNNVAVWRADK